MGLPSAPYIPAFRPSIWRNVHSRLPVHYPEETQLQSALHWLNPPLQSDDPDRRKLLREPLRPS